MSGRDRTQPAQTLQAVLGRLASDRRRTVAYYGNVEAQPGSSQAPRRLLSDTGFPSTTQFTYLVPASAHVVRHEDPRAATRVTICPYGVVEDRARLVSTNETDRRVRTSNASGSTGLRVCPLNDAYLVSAELDDDTYAEAKTVRLVQSITNPRGGPAYHVVINRRGDVIVAAALDDTTRASGDNAEVSIDVAVESALAIRQADHAARQLNELVELPFTTPQLAALAALIGKLAAAYPAITQRLTPATTSGAGYAYRWPITTPDATPRNLTSGAWRAHSPFNHEDSDAPRIFRIAADRRPFDLTTEVFRSADAPRARTGRAEAQAAVSQADTAGAESVMLGAYAALAGEERATEMQQATRLQVFVQRIAMAHHDAAEAGQAAGQVAEAGSPAAPSPAANVSPHVFDFTTGLWGDGASY